MRFKGLAAAILASGLLLASTPAVAQTTTGQGFEVDLDRSLFYALAGGRMEVGCTLFNLDPGTEDFTVECSGTGLAVSPPGWNATISGGGRLAGSFIVTAPGAGEYPLTVTMRQGQESARVLATAVFLPPLSCKFVSPAGNGRTGAVGVGQTYAGVVNFTNLGPAPLSPTFSLPARDLAGEGGAVSAQSVTLDVGEVGPGSSRTFVYNGSSLPDLGTRVVTPTVKTGDLVALYGYEVNETGAVSNVTRFEFTLSARELLGVELSQDRFALGQRTPVTLYVESRLARGIAGGDLEVSLRTDIEARNELSDYAAEPRFEEFVSRVESMVDFDRHYGLPPMQPGVQQLLGFDFEAKACRASESGGSYFLDFRGNLGGTVSTLSVPVSVLSPLTISLANHEALTYAVTGDTVTRSLTVRNLSNSTISGASASFFLDFRERGFVRKADVADTPAVPLPSLGPGEEATVTLSVVPRAPGTYAFFPVVTWGDGLMVYGSHVEVAASAPQGLPLGPYITAFLVIAVPVALLRRYTPG